MADLRPMLNLYPDSIGGNLSAAADFLSLTELHGAFSSVYVLPSLYHSDLDRGFCVVDYDLEESLATDADLERLKALWLDLKLDIVLNHASVRSPKFQDLLTHGEQSEYRDFFIDWNKFWGGCGVMTPEGYIQPEQQDIKDMFFRKPELPILAGLVIEANSLASRAKRAPLCFLLVVGKAPNPL
jgi:sucrose phosphorylase